MSLVYRGNKWKEERVEVLGNKEILRGSKNLREGDNVI